VRFALNVREDISIIASIGWKFGPNALFPYVDQCTESVKLLITWKCFLRSHELIAEATSS
jgi:hypothetical protein